MPELPGGFDPSQHEDMRGDLSPIPGGKYIAKIKNSEVKNTSNNTGQMLILYSEIAAGKYAGKTFVTRLNLWNPSQEAVRIANQELATLSRACNIHGQVTASEMLHGIAHVVTLRLVPGDGQYGPKNEATFYESAQGLTEPPVNPEPDEETLAIMAGKVPGGASASPGGAAVPPPPPAGAGASAPPAPTAPQPPTAPAAPTPPQQATGAPGSPQPPVAPPQPTSPVAPGQDPAADGGAQPNAGGAPPW